MVNHRTAVVSQIRGLLLDRGFAFAKSITGARRVIPALLSDMTNELTTMARQAIAELWDLMCDVDRRVAVIEKPVYPSLATGEPSSAENCRRVRRRISHLSHLITKVEGSRKGK
jgi:hypothetical protein